MRCRDIPTTNSRPVVVVLQQLRNFLIQQLKQWRLRDRSQNGYLETRLRPPVSRSGHPQGVLVPNSPGPEPTRKSPTVWNWPWKSCPLRLPNSTPSSCSSRNKPPLRAFEGNLASGPLVHATEPGNSSRNDTFRRGYRPLWRLWTLWAKRAKHTVRRNEESDILVDAVLDHVKNNNKWSHTSSEHNPKSCRLGQHHA